MRKKIVFLVPLLNSLGTPFLSHTADCKDFLLVSAGTALGILGARYFKQEPVPPTHPQPPLPPASNYSSLPTYTQMPLSKKAADHSLQNLPRPAAEDKEPFVTTKDAGNTLAWTVAHVTESILSIFTASGKKPSHEDIVVLVCKGLEKAMEGQKEAHSRENPPSPYYNRTLLTAIQTSLQKEGAFSQLIAATQKELELQKDLAHASKNGDDDSEEEPETAGFELINAATAN